MASGQPHRSRPDRFAGLALRPAHWQRVLSQLQRGDVLLRVGLCVLATLVLWLVTRAWGPPFPYRTGAIPKRDIIARTRFSIRDEDRTRQRKEQARRETLALYQNDPTPLRELRLEFFTKLEKLLGPEPAEQLTPEFSAEFFPPPATAPENLLEAVKAARLAAPDAESRQRLERALGELWGEWERTGLVEEFDERHRTEAPNHNELRVYSTGQIQQAFTVPLKSVRLFDVRQVLDRRIADSLRSAQFPDATAETLSSVAAGWLRRRLRPTLSYNQEASRRARDEAVAEVEAHPEITLYEAGHSTLAEGGKPIDLAELRLLLREHEVLAEELKFSQRLGYSAAGWGVYFALYLLCGLYIHHVEPKLLSDLRQFVKLLATVVLTIIACWVTAHDQWRAEIVPLVLFSLTMAIVHPRELALLLSTATALIVTLVLGQGLAQFIVFAATISVAVLTLGRIRSRTKVIYVGLAVSLASFLISLCVCTIVGTAYGAPQSMHSPLVDIANPAGNPFMRSLLGGSLWTAILSLISGIMMTGLLPFIERIYDVQTDISLLELGDARHPLMQELVRRAPGTYNHSINVASIGEAAAEAIGANGLLVRVGAYFHDIGKMLKPQYFVENQGQETSRHQSLLPAMSTLVIIAHVKDGANLARQHHLPQSIIDFIEQHHGTTLVEYFYRQATKQLEADPDGTEVDETHFRYPGPKPQTKETGVMMLADAVESASRTLVDPTPARIESLVHDILMKRLLDGQFSECRLTLEELHMVEQSLVKSLNAVYHSRIKYPDAQTV
ncbi:MAG TPA: HDIG domain-containing protein [Pirellulaceae bacterium]|nr:HDIG domain-containing protein [Pirellulaceae bacterium]